MREQQDQGRGKFDWNRTGYGCAIGLFVGIAVYAAAKKGLGLITLLPLVIAYLIFRNGRRATGGADDEGDRTP
ncbi:MAG: hypothetical protein R2811_11560 [Flavobacteriales bacterium]